MYTTGFRQTQKNNPKNFIMSKKCIKHQEKTMTAAIFRHIDICLTEVKVKFSFFLLFSSNPVFNYRLLGIAASIG